MVDSDCDVAEGGMSLITRVEWNRTIQNSKIMGKAPFSYSNVALKEAILECITG